MSFTEKVRAYKMGLAQLATELALALIVIAILIGGIASSIFFTVDPVGSSWDATSQLIWPYIFPLALAALLVGILYHMYIGAVE
jgi:hypothetical protein